MAAYFTDNGPNAQDRIRHIGENLGLIPDCIARVQLDGDELEYVRNNFTGIRMFRGRVVTFYGDDAKFIAAHWNK